MVEAEKDVVVDDINEGNEDRTDDKAPFTAFSHGLTTAGE